MDEFHFSTIETFDNCPMKFKLTYLDELKTIDSDDPQNPLILGTAIHRGMETDLETAVKEYMNSYSLIDDRHVDEIIKMEHWIPRLKALIPEGLHEYTFKNDVYMGTADLLVPVESPVGDSQWYDLYDFKYSNNINHYMESRQLHVYKHYLQKIKGVHISRMFFVFIPKVMIRQGLKEDLFHFRKRLQEELNSKEIEIREVYFNRDMVDDFHHTCMRIGLTKTFKKNFTYLCDWCEFKDFCKKGKDYMILPSNERRQIGQIQKRKIWIYGDSFTGKTKLCDDAPSPLNLNTDGNIQFVTMPFVQIADQVTVEGRQTKTTLGWDVFKDAIAELQKTAGDNGFKTVIVDLVEDAYEMCRLYMYDKLGITHESDDTFRAWDKVRTEFFSTMREFFNLPYENLVIISKEDKSRDITRKSGDKITQVKPNLQDKISAKLAGMVDIVVRAVVEEDGQHTLQFKTSEVVFGGGRLKNIRKTTISCDWTALMNVYAEATGSPTEAPQKPQKAVETVEGTVEGAVEGTTTEATEATQNTETATQNEEVPFDDGKQEDRPVRRRRRKDR